VDLLARLVLGDAEPYELPRILIPRTSVNELRSVAAPVIEDVSLAEISS
jgi:hypothetical protein